MEYVVLMKTTELPPLALRVLQLLMDQSSGCLPLVELCSWYKTTFSEECDVQTIKEELVDFVHVSPQLLIQTVQGLKAAAKAFISHSLTF